MSENTKRVNMKKFIIMLSALLAIVVTVLASSYIIFNELEDQLQQNLEDVANQNSLALQNKINANYRDRLIVDFYGPIEDNYDEEFKLKVRPKP